MSTAVEDCQMAKILLKKFGYLEKRVTYLEEKSMGQESLIQKLKRKLKRLKMTKRNRVGQSSQVNCDDEEPAVGESSQEEFEETTVDVKPNLIEVTGSMQNEQELETLKPDEKLSQKLIVNLGVRWSGQEIANSSSEKSVERDQRPKISQNQGRTKRVHQNQNGKSGGKSSKPKRKLKKSHICAFCSKSFNCFEDLSRHMRVHTGERPYKCQICSKSFTSLGNLKMHTRVHTGERPYKCELCSRSFTLMGNLKKHSYIHTGEKHFSCSVCSKSFTQSSNLRYHMSIHKGTFSCSICSKKLGSKSCLEIHQRTHTGERPYECTNCNKPFIQLRSLVNHRKKNLNCQQD